MLGLRLWKILGQVGAETSSVGPPRRRTVPARGRAWPMLRGCCEKAPAWASGALPGWARPPL